MFHDKGVWIVIIGQYQNPRIGNLNGATNDLSAMRRLLVENFGFEDDEYLGVSVEIRKEKLGADHSSTLIVLSNLAHAYLNIGQTEEAISIYEPTLSSMQECSPPLRNFTI